MLRPDVLVLGICDVNSHIQGNSGIVRDVLERGSLLSEGKFSAIRIPFCLARPRLE